MMLVFMTSPMSCCDVLCSSVRLSDSSKAKDSAASTIYELIGEVFEVKGVFKWFRKTFIIFVKVTFGKSVNRYVVAEDILVYRSVCDCSYLRSMSLSADHYRFRFTLCTM